MKRTTLIISIILFLVYSLSAQVITSQPLLPTANDEVIITFNATGTPLAGYTGNVYAHTGVICEGSTAWQYVIGSWGNNTTQPKLTKIATNLYTLTISPSIRQFYSVPAEKVIQKMMFVFRASTNSPQSADLSVNVYEAGLTVNLSSPSWNSPFYTYGEDITIEAQANNAQNLKLFVNNIEVLTTTEASISHLHTTDTYGKQWVKAVASFQTDWVADSVYFYVRGAVPEASLPEGLLPGINITGENEVTLVLSDPSAMKEYAFVIGDFNEWELADEFYMNRTPDGKHYWITLTDLNPSQEYIYQYWLDGEMKLADPYSEKISDPWNDKWISSTNYPNLIQYPETKTTGVASVFQIQQDDYIWEAEDFVAPGKHELIIYELHIRDFVTDDDIKTVLEKLDYLQTLGVNAIELMPINEFEGNDSWGYNPAFYFAADKAYGRKNDYKLLIDECHKRGMSVIIDMVLNHTFGLSPMVQMYFDANAGSWGEPTPDNPWYNPTCPHEPWCWGYDFNHQSDHTIEFIDRVVTFWLTEFKVDGFRFDFTKGFTNVQTGNQGSNYDAQRIGILKRFADHIWSVNPNAYVILEHFAVNTEEKELAEYRSGEGKGMLIWGNMNYNYSEATMGWITNSNFNGVSYKQRGWSAPHLVGYMESHDEERLMYKNITYGNSGNPAYNIKNLDVALNRQKLAGWFFFTIPGPKMIWQFGELGYDYSINHCPNGTISDDCRVSRKPIRWDYLEMPNRESLYNTWAEIIALRKAFPVFETENFTVSLSGAGKYIVLNDGEMKVVIVGNFGNTQQSVNVTFPQTGRWYNYYGQDYTDFETTSQSLTLQPGEYRMYSTVYINRNDFAVGITENPIKPQKDNIVSSVWPNPATGNISFAFSNIADEQVSISLYDLSGRRLANIFDGTISTSEPTLTVNRPSNIPSGVYICRVKTRNGEQNLKVVFR
jgi:glycosidase